MSEREAQLTSIDVIASTLGPITPDLGQMSSPDGAMTLMFSDIDGAESLAERLGDTRWENLLRDQQALIRQIVEHHGGRVMKAERDGFMAAFNGAHAAARCALELQQTFAAPGSGALAEPLPLRIGVHSGFVIADTEQLLGRNVVLAARIANEAAGRQILVSSALKEYTESDPRFSFELVGEFHFKGVLGEHTVYALSAQEDG